MDSGENDLVDYGNVPEFFVDDWTAPIIQGGILTTTAYRNSNGRKVAVVHIVQRAESVPKAIERAAEAIREAADAPTLAVSIFDRPKVLS